MPFGVHKHRFFDERHSMPVRTQICRSNPDHFFKSYILKITLLLLLLLKHKSDAPRLLQDHPEYCIWATQLLEPSSGMRAFIEYVVGQAESHTDEGAQPRPHKQRRREQPGGADENAPPCRICMDALIDTALVPCGHIVACHVCAQELARCPLCRAHIAMVLRTYRG